MAREVVLRFVGDAGNLNRTFAAVDAQAARTMANLQGSVASASASMSDKMATVGASVAAAGASMRRSGARMARNVTLPLALIGGLGIKTAIDYERSMNVLQSVSGATGEQMAGFGRLAQQLGGDIPLPGTSAADAAAAMVELSKAGLSVTDAMGAARGVLQLSAAGGLDNATAATVAANALNAFGLNGSEAVRVADLLAGAANASSADVSHLADSLQMGASVFAAAGVPIEDFITSAGLLANVGIKGSDAGTSLKTMMQRLQNPTAEAAAQMKALGVDIYDAQGRMVPFRDIVGQFSNAMAGLSQEQRDQAMSTVFGADAVRSANGVLLAGVATFDRMKAATTEQGAAAKLAAAQNKGLGGALDGLKSAMETFALKVLVPALPVLTDFVQRLSSLPTPVLVVGAALLGLGIVAGPLVFVFGALATAVGALFSPVGLVIAGIVALGAAMFAAYQKFEVVRSVVNAVGETFKLFFADIQAAISVAAPVIATLWNGLWGGLGGVVTRVFNGILSGVKGAINTVIKIINAMIGAYNKLPFVGNVGKIAEIGADTGKPATTLTAPHRTDTAAQSRGAITGGRMIPLAHGGLLLGLNRPTPILAGEGRGKEDVLAVPHSKGGIGGLGGVSQTNHYYGVPLEEAMQRSQRDLGWRLALVGRR